MDDKLKLNTIRERRRKYLAQKEIDDMVETYDAKCKYNGIRRLTKEETIIYSKLPIECKDDYLKKIGKYDIEEGD